MVKVGEFKVDVIITEGLSVWVIKLSGLEEHPTKDTKTIINIKMKFFFISQILFNRSRGYQIDNPWHHTLIHENLSLHPFKVASPHIVSPTEEHVGKHFTGTIISARAWMLPPC